MQAAPPPPPAGTLSCPGFASTKVIDAPIPAPGTSVRYFTSSSTVFGSGGTSKSAGFGAQDAVIFRFTMPVDDPSLNLSWNETGASGTGQASVRTAVLSTEPCDWTYPTNKGLYANNFSMQGAIKLASRAVDRSRNILLNGGKVYYLNISNFQNGVNVCANGANGTCDIFFTFDNPL